jgi:hypothetical protein
MQTGASADGRSGGNQSDNVSLKLPQPKPTTPTSATADFLEVA